ncbi:MAG: hypothetical protein AAF645_13220, partial [Myxococcota bacterium]
WLRVVHVLGVILWIGGIASVALAAAFMSSDRRLLAAARHIAVRIATPGLVLAWVGGLAMFIYSLEAYRRAPWMHTKITLALVAAAFTGIVSAKVRKAAEGQEVHLGSLRRSALIIVLLAVVNVVLAFLGRYWMPGSAG